MLKFNTTQPIYKIIAASLFIGGLGTQSAFADTSAVNGKIQAKEVVAAMDTSADSDFKKLDVNSDKKISLKEAVKDKALVNNFDVTDANKDGSLTIDEYSSYKTSMKSIDTAPSAGSSTAAPVSAPPATGY